MAKAPQTPESIFKEFTADCLNIFGPDLESIILYGSAARGEYVAGRSDINFMIVLSSAGIDNLAGAMPFAAKWRQFRVSTPLFLSRDYITTSLDTFPIEFLTMKAAYKMVFGHDLLKDLAFEKSFVRLQCERELKAKLLHLRQHFVETQGKAKKIIELIGLSLPAFLSLFQAILFLNDRQPPATREGLLDEISRQTGINVEVFKDLAAVRSGTKKPGNDEAFKLMNAYISEIKIITNQIDTFKPTKEDAQ
jgi:predicted nucleotidyltransferase